MTTPFLYHSVEPENSKSAYTEYDNVDFVMNFEGRKLICNTVRLEGLLRVTTAGANIPINADSVTKKIFIDPSVGIHSVIDNIQTSVIQTHVILIVALFPRLSIFRATAACGKRRLNNTPPVIAAPMLPFV